IGSGGDFVGLPSQGFGQAGPNVRLVIDDEDTKVSIAHGCSPTNDQSAANRLRQLPGSLPLDSLRSRFAIPVLQRHSDCEGRPTAAGGVVNASAVLADQLLAQRQTHSRPLALGG